MRRQTTTSRVLPAGSSLIDRLDPVPLSTVRQASTQCLAHGGRTRDYIRSTCTRSRAAQRSATRQRLTQGRSRGPMSALGETGRAPPVPFSRGSWKARRRSREVKRSETKRDLRATARSGVDFPNRADSPGATNRPLWPDHLGGTRALTDWPRSMPRGESAPAR